MKYYWHDHKAINGKPRHNAFNQLMTLFSAQEVKQPSDLSNDAFLCFVHPGTGGGKRQSNWEAKASAANSQFIVLLSIDGEPVPVKQVADGVVPLERERLDRLPREFNANPNRQIDFMKSVDQGSPKWDLLVPRPVTEHLIAYYLVLLAKEKGQSVDADPDLREKAFQEYEGLAILLPSARMVTRREELSKDVIAQLLAAWEGV